RTGVGLAGGARPDGVGRRAADLEARALVAADPAAAVLAPERPVVADLAARRAAALRVDAAIPARPARGADERLAKRVAGIAAVGARCPIAGARVAGFQAARVVRRRAHARLTDTRGIGRGALAAHRRDVRDGLCVRRLRRARRPRAPLR